MKNNHPHMETLLHPFGYTCKILVVACDILLPYKCYYVRQILY